MKTSPKLPTLKRASRNTPITHKQSPPGQESVAIRPQVLTTFVPTNATYAKSGTSQHRERYRQMSNQNNPVDDLVELANSFEAVEAAMQKRIDLVDRVDTQDEPERVISQFIALKFDVDTNEFSDGTLERWNNMLAAINAHTQQAVAKEQRKMRLARLMWKKEKAEAVLEARLGMIEYYDQASNNEDMDWKGLFADNRAAIQYELAHLKDNQEKG